MRFGTVAAFVMLVASDGRAEESVGAVSASSDYVLWSYGTGMCGTRDRELCGPHTAEENPFNPDEILVAEQYGCDVLIVNRATGALRVLRGERGVSGTGARLAAIHAAHFMPAGPYLGHVLIAELGGEHRILIIDKETGATLWRYTDLPRPLEAIYWDDDHIMASDWDKGVFKIRLSDAAQVWEYDPVPRGFPFYLQRISKEYKASYGGDLLVGYWGPNAGIREINTSDKSVAWEYGSQNKQGIGDVYDRLYTPVRGFRYGIQENRGGLTIICEERSRIFCVNAQKELVWELGGASPEGLVPATPDVLLPTYVAATTRGTLLITDWGRNMIYEISPFAIPERKRKDAYLLKNHATTDEFADSAVMETRGFAQKNVQISNLDETNSLEWRVLASHNASRWQTIHAPGQALTAGQNDYVLVPAPWNFLKVQVKSAAAGKPASVDVFVSMLR